jgi:hypothetical protein
MFYALMQRIERTSMCQVLPAVSRVDTLLCVGIPFPCLDTLHLPGILSSAWASGSLPRVFGYPICPVAEVPLPLAALIKRKLNFPHI